MTPAKRMRFNSIGHGRGGPGMLGNRGFGNNMPGNNFGGGYRGNGEFLLAFVFFYVKIVFWVPGD